MQQLHMDNHMFDIWRHKFESLGLTKIKVAGDSMFPTLVEGDHIFLAKVDADSPKIGDIITFSSHGRLVTHRLIGQTRLGKYGRLFWERGDNSSHVGRLWQTEILGKVVVIRKATGSFQLMCNDTRRGRRIATLPTAVFCAAYAIPYYLKLRFLGQRSVLGSTSLRNMFTYLIRVTSTADGQPGRPI